MLKSKKLWKNLTEAQSITKNKKIKGELNYEHNKRTISEVIPNGI